MNSPLAACTLGLALAAACGSDEGDPAVGSPAADAAEQKFERKLNSQLPAEQLAALNEVLDAWVMQKGEPPASLEEFVREGHLKRLPRAPAGKRFVIDREKIRIVFR